MKAAVYCLLACLWSINGAANAGTVEISKVSVGADSTLQVVDAQGVKLVPLGDYRTGDRASIRIGAKNALFHDITACVLTESDARAFPSINPSSCKQKATAPFVLNWQMDVDGKHFLLLDNRYANFVKKTISVEFSFAKKMSDEQHADLKNLFGAIQSVFDTTFENADFNLFVKPCGQANAFSNTTTADITVCSEIISQLQNNPGALTAIILHEFGHSLLNRWGEPGASEEDMADQFATAFLLKTGDKGREALLQWIQFWSSRDSRAEASNQLIRGDTHTLSIQRARNIQHAINFPDEITRRWNKMLYRHMKIEPLQRIIRQPQRTDDVDLAKDALKYK